jgi:hypothetical protein
VQRFTKEKIKVNEVKVKVRVKVKTKDKVLWRSYEQPRGLVRL